MADWRIELEDRLHTFERALRSAAPSGKQAQELIAATARDLLDHVEHTYGSTDSLALRLKQDIRERIAHAGFDTMIVDMDKDWNIKTAPGSTDEQTATAIADFYRGKYAALCDGLAYNKSFHRPPAPEYTL